MNPELTAAFLQLLTVAKHPALRELIVDLVSGLDYATAFDRRQDLPEDVKFGEVLSDVHVDSLLYYTIHPGPATRDHTKGYDDDDLAELGILEAANTIRKYAKAHAATNP